MFYEIITNQALVVPVSAWTIAQLTKMSIALLQGKGLDFRYMVSSGGMPSAHSAVVTALATTVGMTQGIGSALFGATVILAMIVMYDAAGV
ncbi:MAG: divergent PAP2 family protein, partial [Dehalococcoidales bacterium]